MNNIKKLISSIIVIVILAISIQYTGKLLNPDYTDSAMNAVKAFHSLPEDSVEVIAYGSSHAWKGLDPMEMYKQYGIAAYNYACNWQHINTTCLFLEDSLRTQSPKVVLIETFRVNEVLTDTDMNGEIYYTKPISSFEGKRKYLKQCFGNDIERYISYYVPLVMFHENWNNIDRENFSKGRSKEMYLQNMGYEAKDTVIPANISNDTTFTQKELSEDSITTLDQIVKVCHENNIDIIFYTIPYQGEYCYSDAMKVYAEENNCTYLNLFENIDEVGIDGTTDFQDETHLNDSGAKKVAAYLGYYIKNNYIVTDLRQEKNNIWEKNLQNTEK